MPTGLMLEEALPEKLMTMQFLDGKGIVHRVLLYQWYRRQWNMMDNLKYRWH
jgi:hypothetical protein